MDGFLYYDDDNQYYVRDAMSDKDNKRSSIDSDVRTTAFTL